MQLTYEEDEAQNPSIFWVNPYNGNREVIARLYWPTHPPEKTKEVEEIFQMLGEAFAQGGSLVLGEIQL